MLMAMNVPVGYRENQFPTKLQPVALREIDFLSVFHFSTRHVVVPVNIRIACCIVCHFHVQVSIQGASW